MPSRELLCAVRFGNLIGQVVAASCYWCVSVTSELLDSIPSIISSGSTYVALRLRHLVTRFIADKACNVNCFKRHLRLAVFIFNEVHGHHDHPGNPEENNVKTGYQHISWVEGCAEQSVSSGQPSVEKVHNAELNQVSSTSLSCAKHHTESSNLMLGYALQLSVTANIDLTRLGRTRPECGGPTTS